jgi:hypothetical protein
MSRDDDWSWRGSNRTSSLTPRSQKLKPSRHYSNNNNNNNTTQVVTCNQPKNRSVGAPGNAVSFPSQSTELSDICPLATGKRLSRNNAGLKTDFASERPDLHFQSVVGKIDCSR